MLNTEYGGDEERCGCIHSSCRFHKGICLKKKKSWLGRLLVASPNNTSRQEREFSVPHEGSAPSAMCMLCSSEFRPA